MSEPLLLDDPFRHVSTEDGFASLVALVRAVIMAGRDNSVVLGERVRAAARAEAQAATWKSETFHLSSITDMMDLPSFKAIVGMGQTAVPVLLSLLERDPYHWYIPLHAITGENPVPQDAAGDFDRITQAWLDWGRSKGHRC